MNKILVIDTSILCVYLEVPGKLICGPDVDKWNKDRVNETIETEAAAGTTFVLPLASIIETGNHISQAPNNRWECSKSLSELMRKSANQETPWAAFSDQTILWSPENLKVLADLWPDLASKRLSLGDATIKDVAEYYAQANYDVEILTGDAGLKSYEPSSPIEIPRRRKRR